MGAHINARPVVVTGAGSGIGAALAQEAAGRGAGHVIVSDIDLEAAEATAETVRTQDCAASARRCDVTDTAETAQLAQSVADEHGIPGLVCANAGVTSAIAPLLDTEPADARWVINVNVLGTINTIQSFGALIASSDESSWLMVTGSEHSVGVPIANSSIYTASKHALLGMCDAMRSELPPHMGISLLCPGLTKSQIWNASRRRPDRFGGSAQGDPGAQVYVEQMGMDPATVAQRAFDGLAAGHFLIPTHYNARAYAQKRADEMTEAFDRLAEIDTEDYDLTRTVTRFLTMASDDQDTS